MGAMASPLTGPAGNVEFLVHARKGVPAAADRRRTAAALLAAAVAEADAARDRDRRPGPHGRAER